MQRDRAFTSYEDLEAHYQRRPSAWVEPLGDWGAGPRRAAAVRHARRDPRQHRRLLGARTPAAAGRADRLAWRVHWTRRRPARPPGWRGCMQTRRGHGYRAGAVAAPAQQQLHVDFAGPDACRRCPKAPRSRPWPAPTATCAACAPMPTPTPSARRLARQPRFRAHRRTAAGRAAAAAAPGRQRCFQKPGPMPLHRNDTMTPADRTLPRRAPRPRRRSGARRCPRSPGSACGAACCSRCGPACTTPAPWTHAAPWLAAARRRRRVLLALVAALAWRRWVLQLAGRTGRA